MTSHTHSAASLAGEKSTGRLGQRAAAVLATLRAAPQPITDRQLAAALGFADLNAVRPRVTELVVCGLVAECAGIVCPITGKTVRTTRALTAAELAAATRATGETQTFLL